MPGIKVSRNIFKGDSAANVEQFLCAECKLLLSDPVQSSCGHRFCKSCADSMLENETAPVCPDCNEAFETENGAKYFPDRFVKREINNLLVVCPFSESGCDWEGKFIEYDKHINGCDFATTICKHCNKSVLRNQLKLHLECCPCIMKRCPLTPLGCKSSRMSQVELQQHLQEQHYEHFGKLVAKLKSIEDHLCAQEANKAMLTGDNDNHIDRGWDLVERDGPRSRSPDPCDSGIGQSLTSLYSSFHPPESSVIGREDTLLRAKLESMFAQKVAEAKKNFMDRLAAKDSEIKQLKDSIAKCEKTLKLKCSEFEDRDFRLSLIENSNHNGSMIWKIPQFSQRKADAENGKYTSIFSLPFYSDRYGYKMCLRLYIMGDGIGKGTHLSLFFVVMRGEFDNILQWPFTHKVTFKLINQAGGRDIVDSFQPDPMSSSFRKPRSDMNIASGCPRFVSHTELERGGFIVDDTVFIKCAIDTSTIHHP